MCFAINAVNHQVNSQPMYGAIAKLLQLSVNLAVYHLAVYHLVVYHSDYLSF